MTNIPNLVDVKRLRSNAMNTVVERNSIRLNLWFGAILFACIFSALAYSRWKKIKEERDEEKEKAATLFLEQLRQKNTPLVSTYGQRVYEGEETRREYKPRVWEHGDGRSLAITPLTDSRAYDQLFGHSVEPTDSWSGKEGSDLYKDTPFRGVAAVDMLDPVDLSLYR
jgi:hypothetical protein